MSSLTPARHHHRDTETQRTTRRSAAARLMRRMKLEKIPSKRENCLKNRLDSAVGCSDLLGGHPQSVQ